LKVRLDRADQFRHVVEDRTSDRLVCQLAEEPLDPAVLAHPPTQWSLHRPFATTQATQNPAQRLVANPQS
jgi:hypothetical protein